MSRGFLIYALSNTRCYDYVRHARALAASIKLHDNHAGIALVTDLPVDDKIFDQIINLKVDATEWTQNCLHTAYELSPYHETIHIESDCLVMNNLDHWWTACQQHDMLFTSRIKDFRSQWANGQSYRRHYERHQMPMLYSGVYYFRKSRMAMQFHNTMKYVVKHWQELKPKFFDANISIPMGNDEIVSIASVLLGCEDQVACNLLPVPTFTHMKTQINRWPNVDSWPKHSGTFLDQNFNLRIGTYVQQGIFHYQNKEFLTKELETRYVESVL